MTGHEGDRYREVEYFPAFSHRLDDFIDIDKWGTMVRSIVTDLSDQLPHPASLHRYKCLATFRPSYYIILNGRDN